MELAEEAARLPAGDADGHVRVGCAARRKGHGLHRALGLEQSNYSFLSPPSAGADSLSTCACASASSIAFLASAAFLARTSARFSFFSSRIFSLPSSSRKALSAPSPLFQ